MPAAMFRFKSDIVHRRMMNIKLIIAALIGLVISSAYTWFMFMNGSILWIDRLITNLGLATQSFAIYTGLAAVLLVFSIWALYYLFRPRRVKRGFIEFVDDKLFIKRGKEVYEIPQSDLPALTFELRALPSPERKPLKSLSGGSFMKLPTKDGDFVTELDIKGHDERKQLLQVIDYMRIEYDVPIHVKDESRGY